MRFFTIASIITAALFITGCATAFTSAGYGYEDDIYYNPDVVISTPAKTLYTEAPVLSSSRPSPIKEDTKQMVQSYEQPKPIITEQEGSIEGIQSQYGIQLRGESNGDTIPEGYWANGFVGSMEDRDYAERLIKFHGPFENVDYNSVLYSDLANINSDDWNIYVDGNNAYMFPINREITYVETYNTGPSWSFGFNYGWGYPYYGYGGYYGYYDPWYSWGWGCGPGYYPPYYPGCGGGYYPGGGGGYYPSPRTYAPNFTSANYKSRNPITDNSRERQGGSNANNSMTTGNQTSTNPSYIRSTRGSRNNTQNSPNTSMTQATKASPNSLATSTRKSYTPTYTRAQSSNRTSYNRTTSGSRTTTNARTQQANINTRSTYSRKQTSSSSSYQPKSRTSYRSSSARSSSGSKPRSTTRSYSSSPSNSSNRSSSYSAPRSSSSSRSSSGGSSSYSGGSSRSSSGSSGGSSGGSSRSSGGGTSSRGSRR